MSCSGDLWRQEAKENRVSPCCWLGTCCRTNCYRSRIVILRDMGCFMAYYTRVYPACGLDNWEMIQIWRFARDYAVFENSHIITWDDGIIYGIVLRWVIPRLKISVLFFSLRLGLCVSTFQSLVMCDILGCHVLCLTFATN